AATLLAAQAAAHAALLAAGVPGHAGAGSVTLHVVLAAAGALVVHGGDRLVAAAAGRLDAAVARLVARLAGAAPVPRPPTGRPPAATRGRSRPAGRAPPTPPDPALPRLRGGGACARSSSRWSPCSPCRRP